jgi:hypothetical protein
MQVNDVYDLVSAWIGSNDQSTIFQTITSAVEQLANLGNYDYLIGNLEINAATDCGTYTLPRFVDAVLACNVCGHPTLPRDRWYGFHQNGTGDNKTEIWTWDDKYFYPIFQDLKCPSHLVAVNELKNDIATQIQVFGTDSNGLTLRTQNPDGSWQDGLIITSANASDFPGGLPIDDGTQLQTRLFTTVPSISLNVPAHTFVTGEEVIYTFISGTNLTPLISGNAYFIGVIDANNVSLYQTQSNALTGVNPIVITNLNSLSTYSLTDQRGVSVQTEFQTTGGPSNLSAGDIVSFTATTLPAPLTASEDFFANPTSTTNFTIHSTLQDALAGVYPLDVSTAGSSDLEVLVDQAIAPITILTFSVTSDFLQGDTVTVNNSTGNLPSPLVAGTNYFYHPITSTTGTLHTSLADANTGNNPIILTTTGTGTSALVKIIPASVSSGDKNNVVANNNNLRAGVPTLNGVVGTPGSFVTFTTTGTMPTPIVAGTVYQVENPASTNVFSLANLDGAFYTIGTTTINATGTSVTIVCAAGTGLVTGALVDIEGLTHSTADANQVAVTVSTTNVGGDTITYNSAATSTSGTVADTTGTVFVGRVAITSLGSGALSMVVSRSFTIGFNNQWDTDTTDLALAEEISLTTGGTLPTLSPVQANYYVNIVSANLIKLYDTSAHATAGGSTGLVTVSALGSGQLYLSVAQAAATILRSINLNITSNTYLSPAALGTFTTTGTLPAPLNTSTIYLIEPNTDGTIGVYNNSTKLQIPLTSIGSGKHDLDISSLGGIILPNILSVPQNEYNTGDAVTLTPQNSSSSLPTPFALNTTYYVRQIDLNDIQLYPTWAQATNLSSMSGAIIPTSAGVGLFVIVKSVPAPKVASIYRIRKPLTLGFIDLIAWDYGRSCNGPTVIGHYEPTEIEPQYRRIKIGCKTAPIRVAFRRRSFQILTMEDWIPVTSEQALLTMCKAVNFLQKDYLELYEKFKASADKILQEQQTSQEGPQSIKLQFDADVFTDPNGQWMDQGWGWGQW